MLRTRGIDAMRTVALSEFPSIPKQFGCHMPLNGCCLIRNQNKCCLINIIVFPQKEKQESVANGTKRYSRIKLVDVCEDSHTLYIRNHAHSQTVGRQTTDNPPAVVAIILFHLEPATYSYSQVCTTIIKHSSAGDTPGLPCPRRLLSTAVASCRL